MCCEKCKKLGGVLLLILGVLFLLRDVGVWNFWNIQWWTAAFLLLGLGTWGATCCPMCKAAAKKK